MLASQDSTARCLAHLRSTRVLGMFMMIRCGGPWADMGQPHSTLSLTTTLRLARHILLLLAATRTLLADPAHNR